jgi:hypothetical protein
MVMTETAPLSIPEATPSPLRLSEALRLGSLISRPAKGHLYRKAVDGYCAIGTIFLACGFDAAPVYDEDQQVAAAPFNWDEPRGLDEMVTSPCEHMPGTRLVRRLIVHLNDKDDWTRPQIADWLESVGL